MTLGSLMKLVVGVVGARFLGAFIGLASQIAFTRFFSPAEVGLILLGMSVTSLVSLVVSGGYPALAFTKLPQLKALNRLPTLLAVHGAFLRTTIFLWAVVCLVSALAAATGKLPSGFGPALFFGCVAALPSSAIRYNSAVANSNSRFGLSYLPDFIVRPLLLLLYIVAAKGAGFELSVAHVLWAFVTMILVIALYQMFALGNTSVGVSNWFDARPRLTRALTKPAMATLVVAVVATAYADLVTMIGGLLLPPADVALIGVSIRLAAIAAFVIQATQQFILPGMTAALAARDQARADAMMLRMNAISLGMMVLGLAATFIVGKLVLAVFGPEYVAAFWLLVLFMVSQAIRALGGMNQHLLALAGKQLYSATACLTSLTILAATSVILTRLYGVMGLGMAVVLAELSWAIHLASLSRRLTGRRGDLLWLLKPKTTVNN